MRHPLPGRTSLRQALPIVLTLWLVAAPSLAATITWGVPTAISGDTDVSTDGVLVRALNPHGIDTTVNGVLFEAMPGATLGDFALSSSGVLLGVDGPFGNLLSPYADLSTQYKQLLRSGKFTHDPPNQPAAIALTIGGLTVGQLYQFQWWVHDARDLGDLDRTTTATAGNGVALEHNMGVEGGVGQFAIGTFTADAMTQAISFQGFGMGTNVGSTQINAFQLRALGVPEPGCLALAVLAVGLRPATRSRTARRRSRR
jgi:hypothetical protein